MFKNSCAIFGAVPSLVSRIQKSESTESSLTLHWTVPAQPHYNILQYQIRYCEKVRAAGLPAVCLKCHIAIRCHDSCVTHNRSDANGGRRPRFPHTKCHQKNQCLISQLWRLCTGHSTVRSAVLWLVSYFCFDQNMVRHQCLSVNNRN